jgi:hypothetical protein
MDFEVRSNDFCNELADSDICKAWSREAESAALAILFASLIPTSIDLRIFFTGATTCVAILATCAHKLVGRAKP